MEGHVGSIFLVDCVLKIVFRGFELKLFSAPLSKQHILITQNGLEDISLSTSFN